MSGDDIEKNSKEFITCNLNLSRYATTDQQIVHQYLSDSPSIIVIIK